MDILYISSVCSQTRFNRLVAEGKIASQFQNQKFHNLLLAGLREVCCGKITVFSYYPIQRQFSGNLCYEEEMENDIKYIYPKQIDKPIINHFSKFFNTYKALKKFISPDSIIVCNVMNFDECLAAQSIGKYYGLKVCAIVADVPGLTSGASKQDGARWKHFFASIAKPLYVKSSRMYDGYLLLTKAMEEVVNTMHCPSIVIEGFSDTKMKEVTNCKEKKVTPKVIMYAGGVHREYGVEMLVEAFLQCQHTGWELHIYGNGNYVSSLETICRKETSIKYFGTRSNAQIVDAQIRASLLVNPRPTHEEFVKYSFPSKTLECMASGTPFLTTILPGMPDEYFEHVYLLEEESVLGYSKTLEKLFKLSDVDLFKKGESAKTFVLDEKNNIVQAKKFYILLEKIFHG